MRAHLQTAAIFVAVGLGALTVTLLHDPMALVPHPPYWRWTFVRLLVISSLALLGVLLLFGVEADPFDLDEADGSRERAMPWRAVALAYLISALASATFLAASALVAHLDRVCRLRM